MYNWLEVAVVFKLGLTRFIKSSAPSSLHGVTSKIVKATGAEVKRVTNISTPLVMIGKGTKENAKFDSKKSELRELKEYLKNHLNALKENKGNKSKIKTMEAYISEINGASEKNSNIKSDLNSEHIGGFMQPRDVFKYK
jgi:hypothetical protein